jgi:predicted aspartyl protease
MRIDRRRFAAGSALALTLPPLQARAAEVSPWIPFTRESDGIRLDAVVNGVPIKGILDNGASVVMLDAPTAQRVHIPPDGTTIQGNAWDHVVEIRKAAPVAMSVGSYSATVALYVAPPGGGPDNMLLLGCELFRDQVIELDFDASRRRIRPRAAFTAPVDFKLVTADWPAPRPRGAPLATLQVMVEGHPAVSQLDLGSNIPFSLSEAFVEKHGLAAGKQTSKSMSSDIGGFAEHTVFSVSSVEIGGQTLHDVPVETFGAGEAGDAVVGLDMISRFQGFVDMTRQDIWLRGRPGAITTRLSKDRAGLSLLPDGAVAKVHFVAPASPAEAQGWKVDERIRLIDGKSAASVDRQWKSGPPGEIHALTLADGSVRRLVLADYY